MSDIIHFCGLIPGGLGDEEKLRNQLRTQLQPVSRGIGGLAAGADILIAEMLLSQGADVKIVLPFPAEDFIETSVRPGGESWLERFHKCVSQCALEVLAQAPCDDLDYTLSSRRAMGEVIIAGRSNSAQTWQLAIWDGHEASGSAGTAVDIRTWRNAGGETVILTSPWPRRSGRPPRPAEPPGAMRRLHLIVFMSHAGVSGARPHLFDNVLDAARWAATMHAANPQASLLLDAQALRRSEDLRSPVVVNPHGVPLCTDAFAAELMLTRATQNACRLATVPADQLSLERRRLYTLEFAPAFGPDTDRLPS